MCNKKLSETKAKKRFVCHKITSKLIYRYAQLSSVLFVYMPQSNHMQYWQEFVSVTQRNSHA